MTTYPLPADTPVLAPYLVVADPAALIDFLTNIFGARELMRIRRPDGMIRHAEIHIGNSAVMMSVAREEYPATSTWLHVYVEDVDAVYAEAIAAGATPIMPPAEKGDGDRRGGFSDMAGNQWWIASRVETLTAEEIEQRSA